MNFLYVAFGGVVGALLRYCTLKILNFIKITHIANIPINIILVNILGSLLLGLLLYVAKIWPISDSMRLFLVTGFLGSYTTYASFIHEFSVLFIQKDFFAAMIYLFTSLFIPFGIMIFFLIKL